MYVVKVPGGKFQVDFNLQIDIWYLRQFTRENVNLICGVRKISFNYFHEGNLNSLFHEMTYMVLAK